MAAVEATSGWTRCMDISVIMNSAITISTGIPTSLATRTPRELILASSEVPEAPEFPDCGTATASERNDPHNSHRSASSAIRAPQSIQTRLPIGSAHLASPAEPYRRIHPAAQASGRTEHRHIPRRDRNLLVRARIARLARLPVLDMKGPESPKLNTFPGFQGLRNTGNKAVDDRFRFNSGHSRTRGNAFDDVRFRHRRGRLFQKMRYVVYPWTH